MYLLTISSYFADLTVLRSVDQVIKINIVFYSFLPQYFIYILLYVYFAEGTLDDRSLRYNRSRNGMPRENSRSPTSPPPGYSRTDLGNYPGYGHHEPYNEEDEVQYANTNGSVYHDRPEPPRVPSPPASYGVAHSYGPTANTSFGQRPAPPQPMPRTCPRQGPSQQHQQSRSSPCSSEGSEHSSYQGHYVPESPSEGSYNSHSPKPRDYNNDDDDSLPVDFHSPKHNIPQQGFILPLSDRMSPVDGDKQQPSPIDSVSDASHMGRYSPSQNNSSPDSTGARSSPVSRDHYSRSHDSSGEFDEELPCINPYAIMDMERTGSSIPPYRITDIPRLTDYPPSEQSS